MRPIFYEITCRTCDGHGTVLDPGANESEIVGYTFNMTPLVTCPDCGGYGYFESTEEDPYGDLPVNKLRGNYDA